MTGREIAEIMNKNCLVTMEKVKVRCTIMDVRSSFGREEVQITPVDGIGNQWVNFDRVDVTSCN